jgi:hypothetical protein
MVCYTRDAVFYAVDGYCRGLEQCLTVLSYDHLVGELLLL